MVTYTTLKDNPREFLSMTSLHLDEFATLLPRFAAEYAASQSATQTRAGQPRQRAVGGGNTARLATVEDKLVFILTYQKTYPLQTALGLQFDLSQGQTNEWIHRLLPLLERALARLHQLPERNPVAFATSALTADAPPDLIMDGTERRRQRPTDPEKQREYYSGKKNAHGQERDYH